MEDFVPYELAVKLKDKGYSQSFEPYGCKFIFRNDDTICRLSEIGAYDSEWLGEYIPCPAISQVLMWLRKTHNLFIVVFLNDDTDNPITYEIYKGVECILRAHRYFSLNDWSKAELYAIEYILDNII